MIGSSKGCVCGDKCAEVSDHAAREKADNPPPIPDPREALIDELVGALKESINVIRIFHGEPAWNIYQMSPEMKRFNAALALARKHQEDRNAKT